MTIQFSDYTFIEDVSSEAATARGDGSVLVPLSVFGSADAPPQSVSVVDFTGREVAFALMGRTFFTNSAAGTEVFAGWSYWEDEDTDYPGSPAVEFFVLSPDFEESAYPRG